MPAMDSPTPSTSSTMNSSSRKRKQQIQYPLNTFVHLPYSEQWSNAYTPSPTVGYPTNDTNEVLSWTSSSFPPLPNCSSGYTLPTNDHHDITMDSLTLHDNFIDSKPLQQFSCIGASDSGSIQQASSSVTETMSDFIDPMSDFSKPTPENSCYSATSQDTNIIHTATQPCVPYEFVPTSSSSSSYAYDPLFQLPPQFSEHSELSDYSYQDHEREFKHTRQSSLQLYDFDTAHQHQQQVQQQQQIQQHQHQQVQQQQHQHQHQQVQQQQHQHQHQQLIHSWVGATYTTQNSPLHSPTALSTFSPVIPALFSPSFLDSLQEDSSHRQLIDPMTQIDNNRLSHPPLMHGQQAYTWPTDLPTDYPQEVYSNNYPQTMDYAQSARSPPASPTPQSSNSSDASPPMTPMYGRLSSLSIRSTPPFFQSHYYSSNPHHGLHPPSIPEAVGEEGDEGHNSHNSHRYPTHTRSIDLHPNSNRPNNANANANTRSNTRSTSPTTTYEKEQKHCVDVNRVRPQKSRSTLPTVPMTQLKPWIQQCLLGPDPVERTVVILTSKVAQKSYGTEKRFLCPPPTAILVGTTWWTLKSDATLDHESERTDRYPPDPLLIDKERSLAPPALTVCISGENTSQTGYIEWYTVSGVTVGQTGYTKPTQQVQESTHPNRFRSAESRSRSIDWYHNHQQEPLAAGKSVSKHLFINDADEKRKRVECLVKVQLANGLHLGTFASKGIKVISKPSKKRQSVKNMELCIHHGTTVSLFNRIRSQTVSTKYLGVSSSRSSPFAFPGHRQKTHTTDVSDGTCFVARTASWDPFIVWVVDTTRSPGDGREIDTPEDYIGRNAYTPSVAYPPPPAIALKNKTGQLVPVLYNQHIVLQCLTTGLVSPVMIIRKVDKASTVVGGALQTDSLCVVGGDYGEEALGDPVSQLHKIALQIVQDPSSTVSAHHAMQNRPPSNDQDAHPPPPPPPPASASASAFVPSSVSVSASTSAPFPSYPQPSHLSSHSPSHTQESKMPNTHSPVSYLACLNDMVGMHKTIEPRKPLHSVIEGYFGRETTSYGLDVSGQLNDGKVVRKRCVSTDIMDRHGPILHSPSKLVTSMSLTNLKEHEQPYVLDPGLRRRVNSLNGDYDTFYSRKHTSSTASQLLNRGRSGSTHSLEGKRKPSMSASSSSSSTSTHGRRMSAASINTTHQLGSYWCEDVSDAAVWTIVGTDCAVYSFWSLPDDMSPQNSLPMLVPSLTYYTKESPLLSYTDASDQHSIDYTDTNEHCMALHGEGFSRDLQVWFGDTKAFPTDYRSRELLMCRVPPRTALMESAGLESNVNTTTGKTMYSVPLLLVRSNGTVYKTNKTYSFA